MYSLRNWLLLRRSTGLVAGLLLVLTLFSVTGLSAQSNVAFVEPTAGQWPTWVIGSVDSLGIAPPPDEAATRDEISALLTLVDQRDEAALNQIAYWNAGPPAYRWNEIAQDALLVQETNTLMGFRDLALLHAAIYDATVAAWDGKAAYDRPRPSEVDASLTTVIPNPASPSYPSEYAATAGAASTVLSWLFPDNAAFYEAQAQAAVESRLLAGVEFPSDVEAGLELGRQVALRVIERGTSDGVTNAWTGSIPTGPGSWTGENPALPTFATAQTWVLTSPDQFRPAPPPSVDSAEMQAELEELRSYERTPVSSAKAMFWEYGAGGRRAHWFWNSIIDRLVLEARLDANPPLAARAYALANMAAHDSIVACWDAKYTYWGIRPFQLDPEFAPVFATPNHPSYPSAHSCISMAVATVLADQFPAEADHIRSFAEEAAESRIWGGIHFRSDVVAGSELGRQVGEAVLAHPVSRVTDVANTLFTGCVDADHSAYASFCATAM